MRRENILYIKHFKKNIMTDTKKDELDKAVDGLAPKKEVLSPEEVLAQEKLNSSVKITFGTKDDSKNDDFGPMEDGIYVLEVLEANIERKVDIYAKEEGTMVNSIAVVFTVLDAVKDVNGKDYPAGSRQFRDWLSLKSIGYRTDGTPSKTRQCLAALYGQQPEDSLDEVDVSDLVGKKCRAMLTPKGEGSSYNKVLKYSIHNE
jgi:hypothetical protein